MSSNLTPIDISNQPDILRLAEEVQATRTPRVLKRDSESIAVVMPLATALPRQGEDVWKHYDTKRVRKALQESAGALAGVDKERLLGDIAAERTQKTHGRSF
jgi:hypothetical protein